MLYYTYQKNTNKKERKKEMTVRMLYIMCDNINSLTTFALIKESEKIYEGIILDMPKDIMDLQLKIFHFVPERNKVLVYLPI